VQNARELGADRVVALGRDSGRLERAASFGATTVALQGDRDSDAVAIAEAFDGTTPGLVLDYVWGAPAETVFASLSRRGLDEDKGDISYVQIGSLAALEAAVPAALLRSRRIRVLGSGAGTLPQAQIKAQLPVYMQLIAEGRVDVPVRAIPLRDIAEAWGPSTESGVRTVVTAD
jgi:NADPH:quinone reductase-like Zn-dependent oxidoreductase